MERYIENARRMLSDWKGNSYSFGFDILGKVGDLASQYGKKALLIMADLGEGWMAGIQKPVNDSLREKGVKFETIAGARPNAPREDLYRLALHVARSRPEVIIAVGGEAPSTQPRLPMFWPLILLGMSKMPCRFPTRGPVPSIRILGWAM